MTHIQKTYIGKPLKGEAFRLGRWEKDVVCGLMDVDFDAPQILEPEDALKLDKITAEVSSDDKERLEAGEVVPAWFIGYLWNSFFLGSEEELEELEDMPRPSRVVQCRTLKTLQDKKLIIAESLGLEGCSKFYSLTEEGKKIAEKLTS